MLLNLRPTALREAAAGACDRRTYSEIDVVRAKQYHSIGWKAMPTKAPQEISTRNAANMLRARLLHHA